MSKRVVLAMLMSAGLAAGVSAWQGGSASKSVTYDVTATADATYTGTMDMAIDAGKVSGTLHITAPTEITGKVAGTANAGRVSLEFPYHMVDNGCDGTVRMKITMPDKPGPASGTLEAFGCGREESDKLTGTVELKPSASKTPAPKH